MASSSSSSSSSSMKSFALVAVGATIGAVATLAINRWRSSSGRSHHSTHSGNSNVVIPASHHLYHHQGAHTSVEGGHRHVPPPLVHAMSPALTPVTSSAPSSSSSSSPAHGPSLLLVIDMQNAFADRSSNWCTRNFDDLQTPISRLVEAAASISSDRVVFTRFTMPTGGHGATYGTSWYDYYAHPSSSFFAADNDNARHAAELTPFYKSLATKGGHDIVPSATFGKCDTSLIARAWQIVASSCSSSNVIPPTLVLCGVSTDCCVLATALAAVDAGLRVRVVQDACAATNHDRSLDVLTFFEPQIVVTTVEEELKLLRIR